MLGYSPIVCLAFVSMNKFAGRHKEGWQTMTWLAGRRADAPDQVDCQKDIKFDGCRVISRTVLGISVTVGVSSFGDSLQISSTLIESYSLVTSPTAAIQRQNSARREARLVRRQVENAVGHFFGGADAAQGDPAVDAVEVAFFIATFAGGYAVHIRIDGARCQAIDADLTAQFQRHHLGHVDQRALGRAVDRDTFGMAHEYFYFISHSWQLVLAHHFSFTDSEIVARGYFW